MSDRFEEAGQFFRDLQDRICSEISSIDGSSFAEEEWQRVGGGGGRTRVLSDGAVFEKAGVNWSGVEGELPEDFAAQIPGDGRSFRATGVSVVIHPRSPMVPTTHANFRYLEKGGKCWFGGGADLTPYYLFEEDAAHFHRTLKEACDAHPAVADHQRFKEWCDRYFYLPHRNECRGVGGIFFDYLETELDAAFAFVKSAGPAFIDAYAPIVRRRQGEPYGEDEREWQLVRRGRYVEFNLLYDRGTVFGLRTGGRTESILMSLPPLVRWAYNVRPSAGSREAALIAALEPRDWLAGG